MAEVQHDHHKRKSEEEHAVPQRNGKKWPETNSHGRQDHGTYGQILGALDGNLQSTPGETPLHLESSNPCSLYPNVHLGDEQALAGEHRNPDPTPDAQELADVAQYEPRPQTGSPFHVVTTKPGVAIESRCTPSYVVMARPNGDMGYYCMATECFLVTPPFASLEEFRKHELVHSPGTIAQSKSGPSKIRESSAITAQPDVSACVTQTIPATPTPSSGHMGPMSLARSPVDSNELKLLDLVASYPVQQTVKIVNGVQVWIYRCSVPGCKTKGMFKSEKLVQ
ncbi:hypothetical protein LTR42_010311 [Elasticomyces elasticus]|nr:hypothetical protein LTR42_010311 [Elasticomyces elasticus]